MSFWANVGIIAGALVSLSILAGLATRFVLVPYLREHLVKPVQETHRQVTQNRHANPEPTVLDKIDDVRDAVQRLTDNSVAVQAVANAAARSAAKAHRRLDTHINWADGEDHRLWSAIRNHHGAHRADTGEERPL